MAKLARKTLILFGNAGPNTDFAKFGSQQAGSPVKTKDIATIQALAAWAQGWQDAVLAANNAPFLEDMNSLIYVHSYETAYILQEGIPEWDAGTTYFQNSIVKLAGTTQLFGSAIDNNLNNAPPPSNSDANWTWLNPPPQGPTPAGGMIMWPGSVVPSGWLECDGSSLLRAGTYANIFAAIGTAWGSVDGTHFNLPDMRGVVPRGWNHGAGDAFADPDALTRIIRHAGGVTGDNVGSYQQDTFKTHTHTYFAHLDAGSALAAGNGLLDNGPYNTGATGGNETRGKNAYVMYIIKI